MGKSFIEAIKVTASRVLKKVQSDEIVRPAEEDATVVEDADAPDIGPRVSERNAVPGGCQGTT